jgi:hypothetical protein
MDMRYLLILSLTCCACVGQSVSIGAVGGGRLTSDVTSPATAESRFYIVGPMIEVDLLHGFAVEFDALYHRNGYALVLDNLPFTLTSERERANSWEFPVLLKYNLSMSKAKANAFVEAGLAARKIAGNLSENNAVLDQFSNSYMYSGSSGKTNWAASMGIVTGAGVRLGLGRLRVSPEVRYTYWTSTPINLYGFGGTPVSNRNQFDILVGIAWKIR